MEDSCCTKFDSCHSLTRVTKLMFAIKQAMQFSDVAKFLPFFETLTFLQTELIFAARLEIVQGDEQLRIVLFLGQQVLFGRPPIGRFQREGGGGARPAPRARAARRQGGRSGNAACRTSGTARGRIRFG